MRPKIIATCCLLILVTDGRRSFVETAPLDARDGKEPKSDDEVKELESLKHVPASLSNSLRGISLGKVSSSVYSNVNGHKISREEVKEQFNKNGKVVAKITEKVNARQEGDAKPESKSMLHVDIPSKGIHKTLVREGGGNVEVLDGQDFSNNGHRRSGSSAENGIDKINAYSGLEYTPLDMAEYIFWTGDEKGVIMAIEELLEEGLMSREEAIIFLQSIKNNLDYMQDHYRGLQKTENRMMNSGQSNVRESLSDAEKATESEDYDVAAESEKIKVDPYDDQGKMLSMKSDSYQGPKIRFNGGGRRPPKAKDGGDRVWFGDRKKRFKDGGKSVAESRVGGVADEDFEDLLERLRFADFLYSEYSLEEVIYQLAKVVFSQSLKENGSDEAQLALQRFATFLEKEAQLGQISETLEKKILDLLIAALSDTLSEHPQLMSAVRENLDDVDVSGLSKSVMLRNLLEADEGNDAKGTKSSIKISPEAPMKVAVASDN